jgi:dihydroxyacetone kinase-like predicted kinase
MGLLARLVDGDHEIVTIITGLDATAEQTAEIAAWLEGEHPEVDVEVHHGGQPLYPYYFGVE